MSFRRVSKRPLVMVCTFGFKVPELYASLALPLTPAHVRLWASQRVLCTAGTPRRGSALQLVVLSPSGYGVSLLCPPSLWHVPDSTAPSQLPVCICGARLKPKCFRSFLFEGFLGERKQCLTSSFLFDRATLNFVHFQPKLAI